MLMATIFTQKIIKSMEKAGYEIQGMTMAITNMQQMLDFYSNVFKIHFTEKKMYNSKLYSGLWGELNLLFCPAEIARNTAVQNRHQFDILVSDLQNTIELTTKTRRETNGRINKR